MCWLTFTLQKKWLIVSLVWNFNISNTNFFSFWFLSIKRDMYRISHKIPNRKGMCYTWKLNNCHCITSIFLYLFIKRMAYFQTLKLKFLFLCYPQTLSFFLFSYVFIIRMEFLFGAKIDTLNLQFLHFFQTLQTLRLLNWLSTNHLFKRFAKGNKYWRNSM